MSVFPDDIVRQAISLLEHCRSRRLKIATAESCTGGLIIAALTEIAGSSDVVDRGFITYSNEAKETMLAVDPRILDGKGAVSEETCRAMVAGAVKNSNADVAVAVTGIAGPGGGTDTKPVGLVHIAAYCEGKIAHREFRFGSIERENIRLETVRAALAMLASATGQPLK
jgi:nicotinamide-nucleotide amidase